MGLTETLEHPPGDTKARETGSQECARETEREKKHEKRSARKEAREEKREKEREIGSRNRFSKPILEIGTQDRR